MTARDQIWVLDGFRLTRVDEHGQVLATVEIDQPKPMAHDSAQLIVGAGAVWVAAGHALLYRIDGDRVTRALDLGHHLDGIAASDEALYVANDRSGGRLYKLDAHDTRVDLAIAFRAHELSFGGGALWSSWRNAVTRLDPETLAVQATFELGGYVLCHRFGLGALWAVTLDDETAGSEDERARLWRIDDAASVVAQLRGRPTLAVGDSVWIDDGELLQLPDRRYRVRLHPFFVDGDRVWGLDDDGRLAHFSDGRLELVGSVTGRAVAARIE